MSQKLLGLVGQGMDGKKKRPPTYTTTFYAREGTVSWLVPHSGWWRFVQWGAGSASGGSGAYAETVVALAKGQRVSIKAGGPSSANTVVTLPSGRVITTNDGTSTGGSASGGDYMLSGSNPGATGSDNGQAGQGTGGGAGGPPSGSGGGAGAPARLPFKGGAGADNAANQQSFPGAGAHPIGGRPGEGFVMAILQNKSGV